MNKDSAHDRWSRLKAYAKLKSKTLKAEPTPGSDHRESVELLASVLWHLECAESLGPFPEARMLDYREAMIASTGHVPWTLWAEQRRAMSASRDGNKIHIVHLFADKPHDACAYVLQATLIGDAAMRLGGMLGVLREGAKNDATPILASNNALLRSLAKPEYWRIAYILAYRDAYMHGEAPRDRSRRLAALRLKVEEELSLGQLSTICLEVWEDVFQYYRAA